MIWKLTRIVPEHRAYDGVPIEHKEVTIEIPFKYMSDVYHVHRKKWWKKNSPYVITKRSVTGAWVTNIAGVILDGDYHISEDEFSCLFTERNDAIDYCLEKNKQRQVKIYGE